MRKEKEIIDFDRSKIYQKLDYKAEPIDYKLDIPWRVQQQIAETNGKHYRSIVGKLTTYPSYELAVKKVTGDKIMLDIGTGWGRWLAAGSEKGYIPIGLDLRLEFCQTANKVMRNRNIKGYTVVGDLENLPFRDNIFDLVWSFSVIQHTHKKRLIHCLSHINRILNSKGFTKLEFPNKNGLRNRLKYVERSEQLKDDYNNWYARYYTPKEYQNIFHEYLDNYSFENHSFFGIGVLKEDLKYVSFKNKCFSALSLLFSSFTRIIPPLKHLSDSIYITATKKEIVPIDDNKNIHTFLQSHNASPGNNLNIVPLLRCPISGKTLKVSNDQNKLISSEAGVYYPVVDKIPILIKSEAVALNNIS